MGLPGGEHRLGSDPDVAVGAVLETDRAGEPRGQFAVHLALGRAGPDGTPAHEVGDVLRRDHVEKLAAGRQAERVDLHEQFAGDAEPLVDPKRAVDVGIVDEPLPADRRPRLLKVDPHHDLEVCSEPLPLAAQPAGIVDRRLGIVDRAGADHDDEPVILSLQDGMKLHPRG